MIDKTTLHSGKDCWTTPRSSPPQCHVGALVQMIGTTLKMMRMRIMMVMMTIITLRKKGKQKSSPLQCVTRAPLLYFIREPVKNVLADFVHEGGTPHPTLLTENHFAKKPLAERGDTPCPPLTENQCEKKKDFFLQFFKQRFPG